MDHEHLAERIERRIDKLESKLDPVVKQVVENKKDIDWLRGSAKILITLSISLVGILLTALLGN